MSSSNSLGSSISLVDAIRVILAERRRMIRAVILLTVPVGAALLFSPRKYTASFSVTAPQGASTAGAAGGLAAQFGLMLGGTQQASPEYVAALITLPSVVATIADSSIAISDGEGTALVSVAAFLDIDDTTALRRRDKAVEAIISVLDLRTDRATGIVTVSVTTESAAASRDIGRLLLDATLRYHEDLRRERGKSERTFLDAQVYDAEVRLADSERLLSDFRAGNRGALSPALEAELQRRTRSASIAADRYGRLLAARDEAKLAELRTTPPLTVLEAPWTPGVPKPRGLPLLLVGTAALVSLLYATALLVLSSMGLRALPAEATRLLLNETLADLKRPWSLLLPTANK